MGFILNPYRYHLKLATRVFTDSEGHPAALSLTHTFTAKSLGDEAPDRIIVIAGGSGGYHTAVTGITVGGNACTEAIQFQDTARAWIYYVALPTGTTGDVVVTFASAEFRSIIGVYALYGASGAPSSTASGGGTSGTAVTGSVVKKANGVCFGACFQDSFDPPVEDHTYTNLTKDAEVTADDSGSGSVASEEVSTDVTETITVVSTDTDGRQPLVAAHWEAA
jgi:hypothetical protein